MPKFKVPMVKTITAYVNVEADNEDQAYEKALDNAPEICAICTGWGSDSWSVDADADWEESDGEGIEEIGADEEVVNEN